MKNKIVLSGLYGILAITVSCNNSPSAEDEQANVLITEVDSFLNVYTAEYQKLYYTSAEAEWELNTHIIPGDTIAAMKHNWQARLLQPLQGARIILMQRVNI